MPTPDRDARAGEVSFAGVRGRGAVEHVDLDAEGARRVAAGGFWAVVGDFEGPVRAWRFAEVERTPVVGAAAVAPTSGDGRGLAGASPGGPGECTDWRGPAPDAWASSLDEPAFRAAVDEVRDAVREGDVYQVNVCRVLSAPLTGRDGREPSASALAARLARGNPAPYGGFVHVPDGGVTPPVWVVTASPELFLRLEDGHVTTGPIKGTARTADGLTDKDRAENVMIADMVRNDLQRVCRPGTVEVTDLLAVEQHPGLVHLVTTVRGRLVDPAPGWAEVLAATYPPASVSGAPKHSALRVIDRLEPVPRGPYCGAVGWVDADAGRAELAVGIRTFWWVGGVLRFGTGAGITWGSDPGAEWSETELKARRLVALASDGAGSSRTTAGPPRQETGPVAHG